MGNLALLAPLFAAATAAPPPPPTYSATRTLDRSFSGFPAWGGGNVDAQRFDFSHNGEDWELWQVVPFDGAAIGGGLGNCRIQLRNRSKNRGQNTLAEMPTSIVLRGADWTGLPWTFTRTTNGSQFTNVASGNSARKAVAYIPDRANPGTSPSNVGIQQGESFTIDLIFGQE